MDNNSPEKENNTLKNALDGERLPDSLSRLILDVKGCEHTIEVIQTALLLTYISSSIIKTA